MQVKTVDKKYITTSAKQTQKLGEKFAQEVLGIQGKKNPIIVCLSGNLGGGKTTFMQGFAKGLGVKEKVLSPTFVIMKKFKIPKLGHFYHLDCYRLKDHKDVIELEFKEIIKNPRNIIAIEWPKKIKKALPKSVITIKLKLIDKNTREIIFKM